MFPDVVEWYQQGGPQLCDEPGAHCQICEQKICVCLQQDKYFYFDVSAEELLK